MLFFPGFWIWSPKTVLAWRSCSQSLLVLTPNSEDDQKTKTNHYEKQRHPSGYGEKTSPTSFVPATLLRDDVTRSTSTSIIPVFTRSAPLADCVGCSSPYPHLLVNENETSGYVHIQKNGTICDGTKHCLSSRGEGLVIS